MFIGFYSLANFVTMFGLLSAITACFLAANGDIKYAIYLMFLSLLCDMFDGKIARSQKNRTEEDRFYGVQIDSLCDVISFGVTPCFIAFSFGFDGPIDVLIYGLFVICGAIRLAYFNTLANKNQNRKMKYFRGIPIPMSTFLVTFLFVLTTFIPANVSVWIFRLSYLALALAFILNIKVKKPNKKKGLIFLSIEIILLLILLIAGDCKAPTDLISGEADNSQEVSAEVSNYSSDSSIEESSMPAESSNLSEEVSSTETSQEVSS